MPSVVVIGSGVAGLSAAVELADAGWSVTLCEQRSFCGGRAYSFREPKTGDIIDNGQHMLMGCYSATFKFLEKICASDGVEVNSRLQVRFVDTDGKWSRLDCPDWPAPWHLLAGLWRMRGFPKRALWRLIPLWSVILRRSRRIYGILPSTRPAGKRYAQDDTLSVSELLNRLGQDAQARERFWMPLVLAVCNEVPERASAAPLLSVFRETFCGNGMPKGLAFPNRDLSALFVDPALAYLRARGAQVWQATTVEQLVVREGRVVACKLRGGAEATADAYISAIPPKALHRLASSSEIEMPDGWSSLSRWEYSPIISVHLWFDRPVMEEPMIGLVGSRFQWVFSHGTRLSLVISAAREEAAWPREQIIAEAGDTANRYFPAARGATILHAQITKELEATVSIAKGTAAMRLPTQTVWPNLFLAGDWTDTGLPETIEGAIRSGQAAAKNVLTQPHF